ncbi:DUF3667 domain-containing protein [Winogradskyella haliclonae]|uniref:DUF3667 domain-containing protein n=1 Tax=Winogradskyella haliclonae TaxID=2048558 RepID=A0ABQ2BZ35_9FLAO|nr:DUF3667 domain-containing protein [Winogradskyella haliclonae]GGI57536.1 hypothetical protein GCM10011444_18450 [Winogradskyella haliclonae]
METKKINCQNCEEPFDEGFKFCPNCGQKTNEELTIGVLFYNTISNYFSFDARFLKSFIPLMFRPGYLAKRFLAGKRLLYLHPAQMYLFVSVIFFFLFSFVVAEWKKEANAINKKIVESEVVEQLPDEAQKQFDSIQKAKVLESLKKNKALLGMTDEDLKKTDSIIQLQNGNNLKTSWDFNKKKVDSLIDAGADDAIIYKEMGMSNDAGFFEKRIYAGFLNLMKGSGAGSVIQRSVDAVPIAMFILLPLFALLLKLFYFKRGRYSHHLVFSFYFFSFLFTLFSLLLCIDLFIVPIPGWISWLLILSTFFYFYVALLNFYRRNWFFTFVKCSIITFVFMLMVIPTTGVLLALFGIMNG